MMGKEINSQKAKSGTTENKGQRSFSQKAELGSYQDLTALPKQEALLIIVEPGTTMYILSFPLSSILL